MSPTSYQAAPPRNRETESRIGARDCQARGSRFRERRVRTRALHGQTFARLRERRYSAPLRTGMSTIIRPSAPTAGGIDLKRLTPRARIAPALILGLLAFAPRAEAAATVHRFNLEIGGGATQISASNYNAQNEFLNRAFIEPRGLDGFNAATMSFLYDVGFRFFVRPNVALRINVGQMRTQDKREYLPAIRQDIQLRSE